MRLACPYPYADGSNSVVIVCTEGLFQIVLDSLVYSAYVSSLTPFTSYQFQLRPRNAAGYLSVPAVATATTLPAGRASFLIGSLGSALISDRLKTELSRTWSYA